MNEYEVLIETINPCGGEAHSKKEFKEVEHKRYAISGLIEASYYQLNDMLEDYYDYLDVEVVEELV